MDEDRTRWDARYADRCDGPAASPEPPEALALLGQGVLERLPTSGLALDIACGTGGQAVWLAQRGLRVIALDVSPIAIELTNAAAREHGVDQRVDARVHDLDAGLPTDVRSVSLLVCQRFRGRDLYPQIVDALAVGGVAIVTVLSAVGLDGTPGQFHAPAGELIDAFDSAEVDVLATAEHGGVASIIVRRN